MVLDESYLTRLITTNHCKAGINIQFYPFVTRLQFCNFNRRVADYSNIYPAIPQGARLSSPGQRSSHIFYPI